MEIHRQQKRLHSINNAAAQLDLSRSKLYNLMQRKLLKFVMIDGKRRITDDELVRLSTTGTGAETST